MHKGYEESAFISAASKKHQGKGKKRLNTKKPKLTQEEARAGTNREKEGGLAAGEDTKRTLNLQGPSVWRVKSN